MSISMVIFTSSVIDWKQSSWANLVRNIKIVSLNWSSVSRVVRISKIQWWCSRFLFNTLSWENLVQKTKIVSSILNLVPILIRICTIQWRCLFFFVFMWEFLVSFWIYYSVSHKGSFRIHLNLFLDYYLACSYDPMTYFCCQWFPRMCLLWGKHFSIHLRARFLKSPKFLGS